MLYEIYIFHKLRLSYFHLTLYCVKLHITS
uniref:Uncharacterized protein n=1 Tax=Myoviridae sp. ctkfK18 TaxID=2825165 RepID=A0A8S5VGP9_9CAUD|nr:MAG TPA: hypothetical protein [Myoviridae sp. ctkfK18]